MLPAVDNSHVQEGLALLTGQFTDPVNYPNIRNLLTTFLRRIQDVENVLWNVINSQLLANGPTGQALNQLGDLVGEPRGTLNDTQYLLFILVIIVARRSDGRMEDLNRICQAAVGKAAFTLTEFYPARVAIYTPSLATDLYAQPLDMALHLGRPPSVLASLDYWDVPNYVLPLWTPSDAVSNTGGQGLMDQVSGNFKSVPISTLAF
jgi:hypothetical protein